MLFYADWCGHCKHFMPVWNALKGEFTKKGISYEEHESKEESIMQQFDVQAFPTIKIEENGIVSDYRGNRDIESILSYVSEQSGGNKQTDEIGSGTRYIHKRYKARKASKTQSGGSRNNEYYRKKCDKYRYKIAKLSKIH